MPPVRQPLGAPCALRFHTLQPLGTRGVVGGTCRGPSKSQQTTPVFPPPFSSQLLSPAWRGSLIKEEGGGNKKKNDECNNICISCVSRLLSGILPTSQKEKPGGSLNPGGHLATVRLLCFVDTQLPVITAGLEFCIFLLLGCAWQ